MDEIKRNIELLNKLGYEYDESRDRFYSPENDSYLTITLEHCKDISQVVIRLVCYEKEISYNRGEEHAKFVIRDALGLEP
jgi:hypothetical protein